ncbi:MAG: hypothetical protein HON78_02920 [Legionellales bacterium]|nr:hypothetical protein [Legionellales bacterium]
MNTDNQLDDLVNEAKKELASSDLLRTTIDSLRDSIVDPETPPEIKNSLSSILKNVNNSGGLNKGVSYLREALHKEIEQQEEKVDQYHNEKDLAKEAAWIGVGIAATIVATAATGGTLLAVITIIGLSAAVVDFTIKMPREMNERSKLDPEYKKLGTLGKSMLIAKEIKKDPIKVTASAVTLAGAATLLAVIFVPAMIHAAPIIVAAVAAVLLTIGVGMLANAAYKYSQKEKQGIQQLETSISETNHLLESTKGLQTGINDQEKNTQNNLENKNINTSKKTETKQTKSFEQVLSDSKIKVTQPETSVKKDENGPQKQTDNTEKKSNQVDADGNNDENRGPHP